MKRLLILLVSAAPFLSTAQKHGRAYIDSLSSALTLVKEDTMKAKILATLSGMYPSYSADSGIQYGQQALAIAGKYRLTHVQSYAYRCVGSGYRYRGEYEKALTYYDSAVRAAISINNQADMASAYDNISVAKIDQSDYPAALDYAFKSLAINEKTKSKNLVNNYINISIIYSDMSAYNKAIDYLQKSIVLSEQQRDSFSLANALSNLGRNYLLTGKDSLALETEFRSIKIQEAVGNKASLASNYSYVATAYYNLGNLAMSSTYFLKGLALATELKNKKNMAEHLGNLGEIHLAMATDSIRRKYMGKFKFPDKRTALQQSIAYSQQSADLHLELHNLRDLAYNYKSLSDAWEMAGNPTKALENYKLYTAYYDSVFSKDNKNKIANLEKQRELDSARQQIKIDQLKIAQQNLVAAKRRNEQVYFFIGIGLLILVIIFIGRERKKSENLLLNILPHKIAERLKRKEHPIADHFAAASIIFIDMAGFTILSENRDPKEMVNILNDVFTKFDAIAGELGLEKIKTIGDCYMAVAGLPEPRADHAKLAALMAIKVRDLMQDYRTADGTKIQFRIGLDCGPVVAGVIGKKKFIYDLWGNAVNTASRMESTGLAGEIHCTDNFKHEIDNEHGVQFSFASRGMMDIKGKGMMQTWFINAGEKS